MQFLWKKVNLHHKFSPSRHPSFCHKAVHGLFLFPCLCFFFNCRKCDDGNTHLLNLNEATDWIDTLSSISSLLPVLHIHLLHKKIEVILSSTARWFKLSRELLPWSGSCSFSSPAATSWSSAAGWVGPQKPQEGADVVDQVICNVVDDDWINLERGCDYFDASGSVGRQRQQGWVHDHM